MPLHDFWFLLIAVLWAGYFLLEGFDFGVGMLMARISRDDVDRRVVINTIGPVWDGNEVWLIVAGGATFAAFPEWYASLFSGFYLALLIILVALILRGVAFEFRGKVDSDQWRARWDLAIFWGSAVPAVLWGVAFGNILRGVPLNADHDFTGNFFTLLNPYALLAGATTLTLFLLHGAIFLALKTSGSIREGAMRALRRVAPFTVAFAVAFGVWTQVSHRQDLIRGGRPARRPGAARRRRGRGARARGLGFPAERPGGRRADGHDLPGVVPERPAVDHRPRGHADGGECVVQPVHA